MVPEARPSNARKATVMPGSRKEFALEATTAPGIIQKSVRARGKARRDDRIERPQHHLVEHEVETVKVKERARARKGMAKASPEALRLLLI